MTDRLNDIVLRRKCILSPVADCPWASEMVLNPAVIKDPDTGRIHMLVRVSGPMPEKGLPGRPEPFPIYLAYACSEDGGENWMFDFSRPALAPALAYTPEGLWITDGRGRRVPNYINGCIEDPRLFFLEEECYCTVAGRPFPPGAYWAHAAGNNIPDWAGDPASPLGNIKNVTTSVLYKVDLKALAAGEYERAFTYVTALTDPNVGDDRDVMLFPKKMRIDGQMQYVMIQRPHNPSRYAGFTAAKPSIVLAAAPDLYDFAKRATRRILLYSPTLPWQNERVGASTPPIDLGNGEWLLNFHAKKDAVEGYAQSFMILKEQENDFPVITHLYPEKWIVNEEDFEVPRKFKTPCVFFTGLIPQGDTLLASYGAADQYAAVMKIDFKKLLSVLRAHPYGA